MNENADVACILDILKAEMVLATGCTEPAAIAFVSAVAAGHLNGERAEGITVRASGNMLKNAMAAGIPGTPYTGVAYAAAIGASGGDADAKLQVFDHIAPEAFTAAEAMVNGGDVEIFLADQLEKLYVDVTLRGPTHTARAVISGSHTNVSLIEEDGRLVFGGGPAPGGAERVDDGLTEKESSLSVRRIFEFVSGLDPSWSGLRIIRDSIAINSAISEEGLKNDYGLMIGKMMLRDLESGVACDDMIGRAVRATTAGADARMAGLSP
jgi:L-cysteine desulfidase